MTFPAMTCPLHIFEPKYRLMMRRCIETNSRRFGMCVPLDRECNTYVDYGTVLFISSLEYTPDGRSLVTTVGERRFRVIERSTRDGYAVARIQFLSDEVDPDQESLDALQVEVYEHCNKWLQALPLFTRLMILQAMTTCVPNINDPPTSHDGPLWVWWFVNAMPVTVRSKLEFLQCTSLRERLRLLKEILPLPS
ncbi:PREDICTED: LON peptidase N-terminal domain and RING finger protein 3-like [Amphimedon queenslandica]|uniref:Lon N-terminal domain-containing protein n=1 Tax=Amphimedon queenslandica TaxID=400682 RepID=A0A1X7THJ9_AMPQE|nr:PREDICTED: LON peptidase N-terminal domain and RING finger protein 3-like [Amphimedon queenslandica]|eukprot:XP_003390543.2 PREDICTED: LON peptidase N-terminal domain and RING finger protein 3-like [Amphimedon queenslandica]